MGSKFSIFCSMGNCLGTKSVARLQLFVLRQKDASVFLGYLQKMCEVGRPPARPQAGWRLLSVLSLPPKTKGTSTSMVNVINKITSLYPMSDETIQTLKKHVSYVHFPKKSALIQADTCGGYAYFIEKGITRSFWLVNQEEITTSFAWEGSIVFSMDELYYGKTSEEFVEAVEEVDAYRIAVTALTHLFETNIELCNWGRIIHQNEYRRLHRSHKEQLTLSAKERYKEFERQFPEIGGRVNWGYVASYLGMTLPTLSRIRGAISKGL